MNRWVALVTVSLQLTAPIYGETGAVGDLGVQAGREISPLSADFKELQDRMSAPRQLFRLLEREKKPGAPAEKGGPAEEGKAPQKFTPQKLLAIRPEQFGQVYLMAAMVEKGTTGKGVTTNEQWGENYNYAWYFQRAGDRVQFMHKDLEMRAQAGTPAAKTIEASVQDNVMASAAIVEIDAKTGEVLIDARELFTKDLASLAVRIRNSYAKPDQPAPAPILLLEREGVLHSIGAFPKNMEVSVQLSFGQPVEGYRPVASALTLRVHYSLCALPDSPGFTPREADRRVGYYTTTFKDLGRPDLRDRHDPYVQLIQRWNLQKVDPKAAVSDVKNPIVWWIDPTVPHEFREHVRAGILVWNSALEAAGLRNAIVVKDVEKDMTSEQRKSYDPADISYNVVRWILGEQGAEAPWRTNPFTGEIFSARIRVGDMMGRSIQNLLALAPQQHQHFPGCEHWAEMRAAADGLMMAETVGRLTPEEREKALGQYMRRLIAHEAGHTLGLRHNFKARGPWGIDELGLGDQDVTTSFMHYVPANIAAPGKKQGRYYQGEVGPYDKFAVEYGYRDASRSELQALASRAKGDPLLAYGSDEDVGRGRFGTDPDVQRWVIGRDALEFARRQTELAGEAFKKVESDAASGAVDQVRLRERFAAAINGYWHGAATVLPIIGGVRTRREAEGDVPAFEAVGADEQRAALKYLDERLFSSKPFKVDPKTLQRLASDRAEGGSPEPFPFAKTVRDTQKAALAHIYDDATLTRLADSTMFARKAISTAEVMMTVRRSVWTEIEGRKAVPIDSLRRGLQVEHLAALARVLGSPGAPSDARAEARLDLSYIAVQAAKAVKEPGLDLISRTHLIDVRRQTEALLHGQLDHVGEARSVGR